jgi:CIC family chloride channel protein
MSDDPPRVSWLRLAPAVVLVALAAAGFAIAFRASLAAVSRVLGAADVVAMIEGAPWWERVLLPALGGLGAGIVVRALVEPSRRAAGTKAGRSTSSRSPGGVGYVMEAIVLGSARVPIARSIWQAFASWLAIVTGNSLGREGPLIQFGAAAGEAARRGLRIDDTTARLVLAAGVAAGFASAYNAPIAAALFVVEVVTGVLVLEAVVPVLVATVIATVVTRTVLGQSPMYGLHAFVAPRTVELLAFAGLGLVAAPVGVAFLRWLAIAEAPLRRLPMPLRPAVGGALCGVVLCAMPAVAGNGFEPLEALLDGNVAIATVAWLFVAKPLATAVSVGSGNPGGVFTPTLLVGGIVGTLYAAALHALIGDAIAPTGAYALVGLAAALAATTHAPLTAAVLACELSGDWALVLPVVAACALAAGVARTLYVDSVYTAELTRRGVRWRLTLDGRRVIERQGDAVDVV